MLKIKKFSVTPAIWRKPNLNCGGLGMSVASLLSFTGYPHNKRANARGGYDGLLIVGLLFVFTALPAQQRALAQDKPFGVVKSITFEGAPIATKHFQSDDENFRERHTLAIVKVHTEGYGNWGVYYLGPNSVRDTSVGFGYVTNPWTIPLGPTELELSGALGLVTGYQDYPVPLLAGQARFKVYESADGRWNAGIAAAAMPYYVEDEQTGDNDFGVVATTPFLSVRYQF